MIESINKMLDPILFVIFKKFQLIAQTILKSMLNNVLLAKKLLKNG